KRASRTPIRPDGPDDPPPAPAHRTGSGGERGLVGLPRRSPTNVPWPISSFIGRERDIAAITVLICEDGQRLVTLTGVGGAGKTRLALQVAAELLGDRAASPSRVGASFGSQAPAERDYRSAERRRSGPAPTSGQGFPDGVWFVELASTSSPSLVPRVIAGALGVREVDGTPIVETLLGLLGRKRLLLVLDNCEHLIEACAVLTQTLLTACRDL